MKDWTETQLWQQLEGIESDTAEEIRTMLKACMPDIQDVLRAGGTSANAFTLHDAGHAFRVAEKMVEVIPEDVLPKLSDPEQPKLSDFELALLLLSAYLHDIGMTPPQKKVDLHYQYLLTGKSGDLTEDEVDRFQAWLDDESEGVTPPIVTEVEKLSEALQLASKLTMYYCRSRHNDWSEEWIRENLSDEKLGNYVDWLDDLVTLCRSHHEGYNALKQDRFDPRIVVSGSSPIIVHLRYLAVVLRIADILEFDPERTPEVIMNHREIPANSKIYWWKDHYISMTFDDNRLMLVAKPPNARVHKALEVMADDIEHELQVARRLADETHFENYPGGTFQLPHRWALRGFVYRDIKEKDGAYVYIDGAFRPDTHKLLELLSGPELYGSPLVAVRELLQNAFDAVCEKIAYERLQQHNPADSSLEETYGKLNRVELRLEQRDDRVWFVCHDTGVGMSRRIIENFFLVSGHARRHDVLNLERQCKDAGFVLGRTGQFGIGVLSYFMLADQIIVRTRRNQITGDVEQTGWHFESEGVGSFGELRKEDRLTLGTDIQLRLREDQDCADWFAQLKEYLQETLIRVPCCVQLSFPANPDAVWSVNPGWVRGEDELIDTSFQEFLREGIGPKVDIELLPTERKMEREVLNQQVAEYLDAAKRCVCVLMEEGELPEGLGRYRVHFSYFDLHDGKSIVFLQKTVDQGISLFTNQSGRQTHGLLLKNASSYSWKGIKISAHKLEYLMHSFHPSFIVEIDWHSSEAGRIAINRGELMPSETALESWDWIKQRCHQMLKTFVETHVDSAYASINQVLLEKQVLSDGELRWIYEHRMRSNSESIFFKCDLKKIDFPVASAEYLDLRMYHILGFRLMKPVLKLKGEPVALLPELVFETGSSYTSSHSIAWRTEVFPPDRVVMVSPFKSVMVKPFIDLTAIWEHAPTPDRSAKFITCRFPANWAVLCGATVAGRYSAVQRLEGGSTCLWNAQHSLVKLIDKEKWEQTHPEGKKESVETKKEILSSRQSAAAWILRFLSEEHRGIPFEDHWKGLTERDPGFVKELWELLFGRATDEDILCFWYSETGPAKLRVLTPATSEIVDDVSEIEGYLPDPGDEWTLTVEEGEANA